MNVVTVCALEARLASVSADALLRELVEGDELLATPTESTRTALIIYRQEAGPHTRDPQLTLDGTALLSAIAAAKRGASLRFGSTRGAIVSLARIATTTFARH